ncbi:nuclear transport factor 2 family protein [Mycolicibacterium moriokaense]|nr:nuclear transport factor 2 family protein [Mycolicibacterium moriokaense]
MPSAQDNAATVNRYLELLEKRQFDAIADLYAATAAVADPVGGEVHIGREAIRGFYSTVPGTDYETEVVTLRALGNEVAFFWRLTLDLGDAGKMRIENISTMTFDDEGKIASMKAYWGPENMVQV